MPRVFLLRILFLLSWLVAPALHAQDKDPVFARPATLEPAIGFWKRVYTEVGTTGGFIHDDTRLDVVYSVLDFPAGVGAATRTKRIEDEKKFVAATLRKLAAGDDDLSKDERRVRDVWPADTRRSEYADAAERVRFQLGQADRFKEGLIRSGIWREEIKRIFKRQGLPEQLAVLPHVESSFNTYAYSKVGAAGMWQFMRSTGKRFLRIDNVVDERLDPYKASVAAANFLQQNYAVVQSWPLAVTAYNHGAGGMRRAKEQLGTDDIGEIVRRYESKSFGFASRNFYACFLAALEIDSNPEKYFPGVELLTADASVVMPIKNFTSMPVLAKSLKLDTAELKQLNPSLLASVWTGSKRIPAGYELRVPGSVDRVTAQTSLPAAATATVQVADQNHRVRKGETLSSIATKYGVSLQALAKLNNLRQPYVVSVGKLLQLPGSKGAAETPAVNTPAVVTPAAVAKVDELRHKVVKGDTLGKIAARYSVAQSELLALNKLRNANQVQVGQSLLIRAAGEPVANAVERDEAEISPAVAARAEKAEPKSEGEAEALGPTLLPGVQAAASADPADYGVGKDGSIRVEASETLGHYADWLQITPAKLRALNKLSANAPVQIGKSLKLDFSKVSSSDFETRRRNYHQQLQEAFFAQYRIVGSDTHVLKKGESIWMLSQKTYNIPVWLLRQYNPDVDLADVKPGTKLVIPRIKASES
ncbi:MAG: LysM peptidoglycan-binding domain-containing protein [Steroidobacteraceae bacterium]